MDVTVARGGGRARELAADIRSRLSAVDGLRILDRGPELGAIVTVEVRGYDARELVQRLRAIGINTTATLRDYAVIDMDAKGATAAIRISPHYYNNSAEVDALVEAVSGFVD